MEKISVVIITFNEEKNLARCIKSVRPVADEIIVLDSYSTDNTERIARKSGAIFYQQNFAGYQEQKNAAIKLATSDFILSLDADEALSVELTNSILTEKEKFTCQAYSVSRINFFCDKFIRHGLWYPDKKIRLFNKHIANWGGLNPHDKIILQKGIKTCHLSGELFHYSYHSEEELIRRNEEISTIAAESLFKKNAGSSNFKILLSPAWRFINGYFFRLGFLDGKYGFVIAKHTAHQAFLKYKKLNDLYKQKENQMAHGSFFKEII
jgi:glycosyltransferase involved in cell wall biosynthesis